MRRAFSPVLLAVLLVPGFFLGECAGAGPPRRGQRPPGDRSRGPRPSRPPQTPKEEETEPVTVDESLLEEESDEMVRKTTVSIDKKAFHINGQPTYRGRTYYKSKEEKYPIEGLLMNSRMVQGIFDDRNPATRAKWKYPDGPWDPERNTREFIKNMRYWRYHGLAAFTLNLQGGNPEGYSKIQPWHNSSFESDGRLRADYMARLESILDAADEAGMVVILGYFYFGQDERLWDERSVVRAADNVTDWLLEKGYKNVVIEICNECNIRKYDHEILGQKRVKELIERVQKQSEGKVDSPAGRLLVSVSMGGGALPPNDIIRAADFILLHGNGVDEPDGIRRMVKHTRTRMGSREKPILFNEDDHYDFEKPDNNMLAAVTEYAGWGFFDYRREGEGFDEGYQSVPANWSVSSMRKYGFFRLLARLTRSQPPYPIRKVRKPESSRKKRTGSRGETGPAGAVGLDAGGVRLSVSPETGAYEIADAAGGVTWRSNPHQMRFGQVRMTVDGKPRDLDLGRCDVKKKDASALELTFRPVRERQDQWVRVTVARADGGNALDVFWDAADPAAVERFRLLDDALWTTDAEGGYVAVPVREGLIVPAEGARKVTHTFDTYAYEGCHMAMVGVVKNGAAALVTWDDPYTAAEVRKVTGKAGDVKDRPVLSLSLVLRKSARRVRVSFLGKGDYVTIAKAYRAVAREKGWLVTWDEKLKGHPDRAKYFGAVNYKLWSMLTRRMNEESTKEESVKVNWTFDEAARIAEHLKRDLRLDRVLFIMGGWIHRGYDNQHPDILPAAPECGGSEAFAACCRRIRRLGYVLSLHDNYQDIYRDSPSWDETYVMRRAGGDLAKGGRWAGGRAYLTNSKMALELAKRPQNLPAVKKLTDADSYFIDTTYAAGLQEDLSKAHPLTRLDDMKWKQAISDYARNLFGSFGSECGREWAIPHADFFEGLTGVSGRHYHSAALLKKLGAVPVPLFEIVYRDCIAMYGKYGYDIYASAPYVLHHVSIGRPLHYHSIPPHLYWKGWTGKSEPEAVAPKAAEVTVKKGRRFDITYHWQVEKPLRGNWFIFVHFTDPAGREIRFQNDHPPKPPFSAWPTGDHVDGPHPVTVPPGMEGTFDVRVGFYSRPSLGRVSLLGESDNERRYVVGRLRVAGEKITFTPVTPKRRGAGGDPALFTRADGGWAEGMHPMDIYVKNTYEVLSPLNEITSRMQMTGHEFLTADRKVIRTVFGRGAEAVTCTVNMGQAEYRVRSKTGGDVVLPPLGFLVRGPTFVAFCASASGGLTYDDPPLFAVRSLDSEPIGTSGKVRIWHGFGDPRIRLGNKVHTVAKEATVAF